MELLSVRSAKKSEAEILGHLVQLYLHDFSEFEPVELNEQGLYEYPYLNHYWEDPNRYPYLIRVDDKLAGFALLRFEVDPVNGMGQMNMSEFFVMRRFRRQSVGEQAACKLWDQFPGGWELKVLSANTQAYPFWRKIISNYTHNKFDERKSEDIVARWITFKFESRSNEDTPDAMEFESLDF